MSFDQIFDLTAGVYFILIISTLHAGFIVSVHRVIIMENRRVVVVVVVDPDNVHGSHRPVFHEHQTYNTRERPSVNFVQLLYIAETWMYRAACKVGFQPFNLSYSQLTFFNFYKIEIARGPTCLVVLRCMLSSVPDRGTAIALLRCRCHIVIKNYK